MSATRLDHVDLPITGMTCASCATRVERRLNELDGVTRDGELRDREGDASTSTRRGRPPSSSSQAVEAAGYQAALPAAAPAGAAAERRARRDRGAAPAPRSSPPCCRCPCC